MAGQPAPTAVSTAPTAVSAAPTAVSAAPTAIPTAAPESAAASATGAYRVHRLVLRRVRIAEVQLG